jgi:hypothetical protein
MVDPWQKSKKRSSGKSEKKSRQHKYPFYLDANFDCPEVRAALDRVGVRYAVPPDREADDEIVFADVRTRVFITADKKQRHRKRQQYEIRQRKMRHFSVPGNLSAQGKAELLIKCKNKIWELCRTTEVPFSYGIDKRGAIKLRMDKRGIVHGREEE